MDKEDIRVSQMTEGQTTVTFLVAAIVFALVTLVGWLGGLNVVQRWFGG